MLVDPTLADFQQGVKDLSPTLVYVSGRSHYEQNQASGLIGPLHFTGQQRARKQVQQQQGEVQQQPGRRVLMSRSPRPQMAPPQQTR